MPRDRNFSLQASANPTSGLIASARRHDLRDGKGKNTSIRKQGWQQQCWYFYDIIGEYYYSMNWVGNLLSRAKLQVTKNGKTVSSGVTKDALQGLFGGPLAQKEMLRQLGVHLSVAGEAYVIGESRGDNPDKWSVVSNLRLQKSGDQYVLDGETLKSPLVLQVFRPHPLDERLATSASRPVLPILAELEGMTKRVAADIDSRLTGAGLILFPSEVDFSSSPVQTDSDDGPVEVRAGVDGIQDMLISAASTAIQNQESAAAKVPIAMTMAGDQIANVRHLTFWSEFDAQSIELRQEAIRRLALGLDMPPEALTGTGEMNHWNAWQLEEAAIKVHTEPLLQLICDALTTGYLIPYLESEGMSEDDARSYAISADTTELRLRPNRSKEAQELYDRGVLSREAMLRENGFEPADIMDGEELKDWFVRKVASGSTTPELVAEALRILDVPVKVTDPEAKTTEARPTPSLEEHPKNEIPNGGVPPELVAAGSVLVYRALERAGNRLKNRGAKPPAGVPAVELYLTLPFKVSDIDDLLQDAWSACGALEIDCPEKLDAYTRSLLLTRTPPSREGLARYLGGSR